jgi:hypothetical protein
MFRECGHFPGVNKVDFSESENSPKTGLHLHSMYDKSVDSAWKGPGVPTWIKALEDQERLECLEIQNIKNGMGALGHPFHFFHFIYNVSAMICIFSMVPLSERFRKRREPLLQLILPITERHKGSDHIADFLRPNMVDRNRS